MPTSVFANAHNPQIMDAKSPTFSAPAFNIGLIYAGGVKLGMRRSLVRFDLTDPASGPAIGGAATILDARLDMNVMSLDGATAAPHTIHRITRNDWDSAACWDNYKASSPWTTGGGDVATPPAVVPFTGPAAIGLLSITGAALVAMLEWFADNNSGLVQLRVKMDNEVDDAIARWWAAAFDMQLIVTTPDSPQQPIDNPHGATLAATRPPSLPGAAAAAGAAVATPARPARPVRGSRGR